MLPHINEGHMAQGPRVPPGETWPYEQQQQDIIQFSAQINLIKRYIYLKLEEKNGFGLSEVCVASY